jgi:hypothetical protein
VNRSRDTVTAVHAESITRQRVYVPALRAQHRVGSAILSRVDQARLGDERRADVERLEEILVRNPFAAAILEEGPALGLPDWYLGAGGVTHTIWNHLHGYELTAGIKDYDLVYFDAADLSASGEEDRADEAVQRFGDLGAKIDVTNEARVHLWYERRFGFAIAPYRSSEHAISTWPTTATSIGVRYDAGSFVVCAPFGLHDLFSMVVRPNRTLIDEAVYTSKVQRWRQQWPRLVVVPWGDRGRSESSG